MDEAGIKITPDTSGFAAELRRELEAEIAAATAGLDDTVHINIDVDSDAARAKLAQSLDELGDDGANAFNKLNTEQNDLFDDINKNTEKTRDKVVLETTKTRDRVNQRLEPFWRRLKLKQTQVKTDFDKIKKAALDASKAATGVTGNTSNNGITRAEQERAKAYADSEAAARKLVKAEQDLNKARSERDASSSKLLAAEERLTAAEEAHERSGQALIEAERKLAREQALRYPHAERLRRNEEELAKAREAHNKTTAAYYDAEAKLTQAKQAGVDATNKITTAEDGHAAARDRLTASSERVEDAERNVTRAHDEHARAVQRAESAVGRFGTVLENQSGQIVRVGDGVQRLGNRTSILGRIASIAGGAVSGFGNIVGGLGGLLKGTEGAATQLQTGISGLASAAVSAATAIFGLGVKITGFLAIAGAVAYVVGAAGAAIAAIPPLALSAGAAIATIALGMDGIKAAYEKSLKPALDKLKAQVSEVFEQKFTTAFQNISNNLIPQVTEGFKKIATSIGDSAIKFSEFITQGKQVQSINTILQETAENISGQLYPAVQNVVEAFLDFSAVPGVLDAVYGIISDLIQNTADWVNELNRTGEGKAAIEALRGVLDQVEQTFFQVLTAAMNFFTQSSEGFTNLVDSVGDLVSELLDKLGPAFNDALQAASDFIEGIPQEDIDEFVAAVGRLSDALLEFANSPAPGMIVEAITGIIDIFTTLIEIATAVGTAIDAVAGFFEKLQIPLLGAESSTERAVRQFREGEAAAKGLGNGAQQATPPIEGIGDASATAADRAAQAGDKMGTAFDPVKPGAEKAGEGAKEGIEKPVGEIPGTVDDSVAQVDFSPILEKAREVFGALPQSVADGLNKAEQEMKTGTDKIKQTAETGAKAAVDAFKTALGTLGQVATEAVTKAQTAFSTAMVNLQTAATQGAVAVVNAFKTSFAKIEPDVKEVMDKVVQAVEQGVEKIKAAFDKIDTSTATQAFKEFQQAVEEAMRAAQQAVETAMQAIQTAIETGSTASQTAIETAFDAIGQKIDEVMQQAQQTVEQAMQQITQAIEQGAQDSEQAIQEMADQIIQIMDELAEKMYQAGVKMMERLAAGITAGGAQAVAAAQQVASQIAGAFPQSPAKWGPLSGEGDTLKSGGKIMTRLGEGMEAKAQEALAVVEQVVARAQALLSSIGGGNNDPVGTRYEDGSVKGVRRAGDSPDDFDRFGRILRDTSNRNSGARGGSGGGGSDPAQMYAAAAAGVRDGLNGMSVQFEPGTKTAMAKFVSEGQNLRSRK